MYTVVLLSNAARKRFQPWKELLDPFVERQLLSICHWNHQQGDRDLASAIPGLADAVRGHPEWRLLVVGTGSEGSHGEEMADPENPFDFACNWEVDGSSVQEHPEPRLRESDIPIVRLSHMILGYPEIGAKAFHPVRSYWDNDEQRRVYEPDFIAERVATGATEADAREEFTQSLPTRNDVRTEYRLEEYSADEQRRYRQLIRQYDAKQLRPAEMVLLAVRDPIQPRPVDQLKTAWRLEEKASASRFVERNEYHPSCRFVVFDRPPEEHVAHEIGELQFWLSVLTIAINDVPASAFQASRLYQVSLEFDAKLLSDALNQHMTRLTSVRDLIMKEISRPKRSTNLELATVLNERPVAVSFDYLKGEELKVANDKYGLGSNLPRLEMSRWKEDSDRLRQESETFMRRPRRILAKAVDDMRKSAHLESVPDIPMTRIEREELAEELAGRVKRLSEATTRDILNRNLLDLISEHHNRAVRKVISQRMPWGVIIAIGAMTGLTWLFTMLPLIIATFKAGGWAAPTESLGVVGVALGSVLLAGLGSLVIMKRELISAIQALNDDLREYVFKVKEGASHFGQFLTDVQTYMFGKAILDRANSRSHEERQKEFELSTALAEVTKIIDREKALVRDTGNPIEIRRVSHEASGYAQLDEESIRRVLTLPIGNRKCEFSRTGESLEAPYNFVQRLLLVNLHLPEDLQRHRQLLEEVRDDSIDERSSA